MDLEAKLEVETRVDHRETKKRINFLTWGQETNLNDYAWIKNQVQVGILHRSELEIGGVITGLVGDPLMQLDSLEIKASFPFFDEVRQIF